MTNVNSIDINERDVAAYMGQYLGRDQPLLYRAQKLIPTPARRLLRLSMDTVVANTKFPDVSFWQGKINFDIMKLMTNRIVLKAGQRDFIDSQFLRSRAECERVALPWDIYWFYDGRVSPGKQAEVLYSVMTGGQPRPIKIYADWEVNYGGQFEGIVNVVAFMERMEQLTGMEVGMYTGYYWFTAQTNARAHGKQYNYLKERDLWIAWYTKNVNDVKVPKPWDYMARWQEGTPAVGKSYGAETEEIDINSDTGYSIPPPQGEPPMETETFTDVLVTGHISPIGDGVRLRDQAGTHGKTLSLWNKNVIVEVDLIRTYTSTGDLHPDIQVGDKWAHVLSVNGIPVPQPAWMAVKYHGADICAIHYVANSDVPPNTATRPVHFAIDIPGNKIVIDIPLEGDTVITVTDSLGVTEVFKKQP